ncbi:MAG: NAD(P)H-dependent oxidoreductase subunit E [bacterium]
MAYNMIEDVETIIEKRKNQPGELIAILQDIQRQNGYLPESILKQLAEKTNHSLVDIYGVATFYKSFYLKPRGKHLISVCLGTACHVRGAPGIAEEFQNQLGINPGETTSDKKFSLETVNCLGACALGPIVVANGHYFSNVTKTKVKQIINKIIKGLDKVDIQKDQRIFTVKVKCPRCNHSLMDPNHKIDGYPSIRITISFGNKHGSLWLSSLYGSYNIESEHKTPMGTIIHSFCPHCHAELISASNCTECGAPMVPMAVSEGAMVQICSRRGCKSHMLDLNGVNF